MRQPSWMDPADSRILQYLHGRDAGAGVAKLTAALHYRESYLRHRCGVLAEQGLVQPVGHREPTYELRNLGRDFVTESVPVAIIDDPGSET